MAQNNEIHRFAVCWFEKHRSPDTSEGEVLEGFAEDASLLLGSAIISKWRFVP